MQHSGPTVMILLHNPSIIYLILINGNTGNGFDDYNAMTEAIQALLAKAITENKTVRH
jgi:hypothetical protein